MIVCHRTHLEAMCAHRGYSIDEAMPCVVAMSGDMWTIDTDHHAYPKDATLRRDPRSAASQESHASGAAGFFQKAANFAVAAAGHIAAGAPMASEEEIASRYAICSQCEFLVNDSCAKCGCGISRIRGYVSKLSWADQECPVG